MSGRNEDTTRSAAGEPGGFSALQREREGADVASDAGAKSGSELKEAFGTQDMEGSSHVAALAADYGKFPGPEAGAQGRDDKELQEKAQLQRDETTAEVRRLQRERETQEVMNAPAPRP